MTLDKKKFLAGLSKGPGVYTMRDREGTPLYVGKARNLKARVSSYFAKSGQTEKARVMMAEVRDIDIQRTRSETEALLLESNLIKSLKPRFNILLRDDKSYPYLRLSTDKRFPGLSLYRGRAKAKGRLFGPYANTGSVRSMLSQLQKVVPVRQCDENTFRNRSRPCLQYQIKRCSAPCVGFANEREYRHDVDQLIMLLEGKESEINGLFESKMEDAARVLDFESAARYRDRVHALRKLQERQYVSGHSHDADVATFVAKAGAMVFSVMRIRAGQNLGSRHFLHKNPLGLTPGQILQNLLVQYYQKHATPPEIIATPAVAETRLLASSLSELAGRKVDIKSRVRSYRLRWIELAQLSATDYLDRRLAADTDHLSRLEMLSQVLGRDELIERIECFDTSHTAGEYPVASCVVFDRSGAVTSEYRRFNIRALTPGDDYGAMEQVVSRRIAHVVKGEGKKPDLLVIDGGRGQVDRALAALEANRVQGVSIVGIAKGRSRKSGRERLFLPGQKSPLILGSASPARLLLQQIRDEAHRFAITGHRKKRSAMRARSRLEDVPGIGAKKRQALLRHFGGMKPIAQATVEELMKVDGINLNLARRVTEYFGTR